jgi:hypothetical protein
MDEISVTRPPHPSTHSIVAGAHLCDQVAGLLLIEPKVSDSRFGNQALTWTFIGSLGRLSSYRFNNW